MTADEITFWFTGFIKYATIGALAATVGVIFAIILDAAIDLWEQWHDQ